MKRSPIRRHAHRDPVTPELRQAVLERDRGCLAPMLDPMVESWSDWCSGRLTLDHVREQPMMGKRAPSDMAHLVTLCWHHHLETGWATSHRPELRAYLESVA
jgi:hypothetical protein